MNSDLGKVSIIVPVYNNDKYFRECVDSLSHQTYEDLEIILVDDGSTDSCGKMADEFSGSDERIKAFHKENGGQGMARNLGLKHATGDYYCFIDSDDFLEPDFVEKTLNALVNTGSDMVFCNFYSCFTDKSVPSKAFQAIENGKEYTPDEYMKSFYTVSGMFASVCNKIFKKEVFRDLEFEAMICEDAQIMLSLIDRCSKIVYISDVLYHYRRRKGSTINKSKEAILLAEIRWFGEHLERLKACGREKLYYLAQKMFIRRMIEQYFFCDSKVRKEQVRPLLKKEVREFIHNPLAGRKLRFKYLLASCFPYISGKAKTAHGTQENLWD